MPQRNHLHPLPRRTLAALLLVGIIVAAILYTLIDGYTQEQRAVHKAHWSEKFSLSAHVRASAVSNLVAHKRNSLQVLASDTTLRLYLTAPPDSDTALAYRQYLRNYVSAVSRQGGFAPTAAANANAPTSGNDPHESANVGIIVSDTAGAVLLSTAALPNLSEKLPALITAPALALVEFFAGDEQAAAAHRLMVWREAIAPVQGPEDGSQAVGYVFGAVPASQLLSELSNGAASDDGASMAADVVVQEGDQWRRVVSGEPVPAIARLSPSSAAVPLETMLEADEMLHFLSPLAANDKWFLYQTVPQKDAFGDLDSRLFWLKFSVLSIVASLLLLAVLLWRHISAARLALLLQKVGAHEELLNLILEATPSRIFITDSEHRFHYVNESAAKAMQSTPADMIGKSLRAVMGQHSAANYQHSLDEALKTQQQVRHYQEEKDGDALIMAANITHLPISHIPSPSGATKQGIITIEYDVTALVKHQLASKRMMDRLLETLLQLADQRDPNAAQHSHKVAALAEALAVTMQLGAQHIETARLAGLLLNMGKLMVPETMLSSDQTFSGTDKARIKLSLQQAFDYLADIPFDGPVLDTLRQSEECPDATGPLALSDASTLVTARILKVANSFVALTSPRSYRKPMSEDKALSILEEKSGSEFSKAVVSALAHYQRNLRPESQQ